MKGRSARRRVGAVALAVAVVAACSTSRAVASPPVPLVTKLADLARAQVTTDGTLATPPGTDAVASMFALAPGSGSGWRTQPGTSVLAVTKGALTLHSATGCTASAYKAGQAAVLPPGRYLVINDGGEPLEFAGVFAGLPKGAPRPLVDGAGGPAPAGCAGHAAASVAAAASAEYTQGTMVPTAAYGQSLHALHAHAIAVDAGKDMTVGSYAFAPGFRSGWFTHAPALTILTRGVVTYYEGRDGACVKSEEYHAGQAYTHVGGLHLAANEGSEPIEAVIVWFDLPHGGAGAVPVLGNTLDENDFTPLPPGDCPRVL